MMICAQEVGKSRIQTVKTAKITNPIENPKSPGLQKRIKAKMRKAMKTANLNRSLVSNKGNY
jgi:hypothetical protein